MSLLSAAEALSSLSASIGIMALVSLVLVSASGAEVHRIGVGHARVTVRLGCWYRGGLVLHILSRGAGIRQVVVVSSLVL